MKTITDKEFPCSFETIVRKILRLLFHVLAHIYHVHFKEIVLLGLHSHLNCIFAHLILFNKQFALLDPKELDVLHDLAVALRLLSEPALAEPMQCVTPSPTPEPPSSSVSMSSSSEPPPPTSSSFSSSQPQTASTVDSSSATSNCEMRHSIGNDTSCKPTNDESICLDTSPVHSNVISSQDIVLRSGRGTPMESESSIRDIENPTITSSISIDSNDGGVITTQCRSISPFANAGSLLTLANVASQLSSVMSDSGDAAIDANTCDDCPMQEEPCSESRTICDSQPIAAASSLFMPPFGLSSSSASAPTSSALSASSSACVPGTVQSVTSGYWSIDEPSNDGPEKRQLEMAGGGERRVHKRKSFGELDSRGSTRESSSAFICSFPATSACSTTSIEPSLIIRSHSFHRSNRVLPTLSPQEELINDRQTVLNPMVVPIESMSIDQSTISLDSNASTSVIDNRSLSAEKCAIDNQLSESNPKTTTATTVTITSGHRITQSFGCLQLQPESGAL